MAVTNVHPIRSTLAKAVEYIINPDKTESLAMCYIEECVNKPTEKRFIFYLWDRKNKWYNSRTLIMDEALLVNHLMYNNPQMLQKLLDECTLYGFVKRRVKEYCNAVDQQTEKLCKADKEMQLALAQGNTEQYAELEKNNRLRAEEMSKLVLYAA